MTAARGAEFNVVLVDDLSRLARDNHLMLSIIAELHFESIRVISDGAPSRIPYRRGRWSAPQPREGLPYAARRVDQ
jgi:hypothetical protein